MASRLLKGFGYGSGVLALFVGVAVGYVHARYPITRPASAEAIERTPERLARGRYLVEHVAACGYCHSQKHEDRWARPTRPGGQLAGGLLIGRTHGVPFDLHMPNLTPHATGLGGWSDGEVLRAIREGVDRNGKSLFPAMPYERYHAMSDEDARSIVAYLRTVPPVDNAVPESSLDFPLPIVIRFAPRPVQAVVATPTSSDGVKYGEYLAMMASCMNCHTPFNEQHEHDPHRLGAGGFRMAGPWGAVTSTNITSHPDGYLAHATREQFVARFKAHRGKGADDVQPSAPGTFSVMPWIEFSEMRDEDLGAIYDYLKSLPPQPGVQVPYEVAGTAR
jgi:mono/diheme cytochrome c family protein